MGATEIFAFKRAYKEFLKVVNYANEQLSDGKDDPARLKKYRINIERRYAQPMDEAWNKLTESEKKKYLSVYQQTRNKI